MRDEFLSCLVRGLSGECHCGRLAVSCCEPRGLLLEGHLMMIDSKFGCFCRPTSLVRAAVVICGERSIERIVERQVEVGLDLSFLSTGTLVRLINRSAAPML